MRHRETTRDIYNSVGKLVMAELDKRQWSYKYACTVTSKESEPFIELESFDYRSPGAVDPCAKRFRIEGSTRFDGNYYIDFTGVNNTDEKG